MSCSRGCRSSSARRAAARATVRCRHPKIRLMRANSGPKSSPVAARAGSLSTPASIARWSPIPTAWSSDWPAACDGCGAPVSDRARVCDGEPVRHQVSEIVVRTEVTEHRRMRVRCACGRCTLAELPAGVPAGAFGPAVAAAAATLTAARVSRREVARLLADLCGVQISAASVERLVKQTSDALEECYVEVLAAVDSGAVRGADETSW
jgi:hypothetical protein